MRRRFGIWRPRSPPSLRRIDRAPVMCRPSRWPMRCGLPLTARLNDPIVVRSQRYTNAGSWAGAAFVRSAGGGVLGVDEKHDHVSVLAPHLNIVIVDISGLPPQLG